MHTLPEKRRHRAATHAPATKDASHFLPNTWPNTWPNSLADSLAEKLAERLGRTFAQTLEQMLGIAGHLATMVASFAPQG
jgi:hypothetical protein